jgi:hypothetical protein
MLGRVAAAVLALAPTTAAARDFASPGRAGPAFSPPEAALSKALVCKPEVAASSRAPVLLVPGTTLTPQANFGWNYMRALDSRKIPWCSIELPGNANDDVQVAGEYVAYAIRRVHAMSGKKIQVLGFSQGGMVPRWALRFWPDTRAMVDDVVGLDPSNHGTLTADYCIQTKSCPAAFWQQRASAAFIGAVNSLQETFAGISYTSIFSATDEVVTPNLDDTGSSSLRTGDGMRRNVRVQDICPNDASEHLAMGSYDAVGYAVALDALSNAGPADPARVAPTVCAEPFHEGVDGATFAADYAAYLGFLGSSINGAANVDAEPPLACYVFADCPVAAQGVAGEKKKAAAKRRAAAKRKAQAKRKKRKRRKSARARRSPAFTG